MTRNGISAWRSGCPAACWSRRPLPQEPSTDAILETYADIALAGYEDSLTTAKALDAAIDALIANPTEETLTAARDAWKAARIPYQQTEAFRFGNPIVDEWEGRVNAWPLDEGLIDYVDASYGTESDENGLYTANVIANPKLTIDGAEVDATEITPEFLQDTLQEAGGIEANVATGYHAIEFLLWGQDLNGTGPGAGDRPATDYSTGRPLPIAAPPISRLRRPAGLRSRGDGRQLERRWRGARGAAGSRPCRHPHRHGLAVLRRSRRRAHEARPAAARSGGGARLLLGQHPYQPPLRRDRRAQRLSRQIHAHRRFSVVEGPSVGDLIAAKDAALDTEIKALLDDTVAKMEAMAERADDGRGL